jgi:membrane fusion protein (multidrug efflux system)
VKDGTVPKALSRVAWPGYVIVFTVSLACLVIAGPTVRDTWFETTTDDAAIEGRHTMLAPKVAGMVVEVLFDDNDEVEAGQALVRLDPRDYHHALAMSQAERLTLEARLKDATLKNVEAKALFAAGAINGQQRDTAESNYLAVKGQHDRINARIEQDRVDLSYAVVRAPHAGRVGRRMVEAGSYAHAGQALVSFVAGDERFVIANFKETQLARVAVGTPAEVTVDALAGRTFQATVQSHSPASGAIFSLLPPDNATGNYIKIVQRVPVKLQFTALSPQDKQLLAVGLNATVRIRPAP